jgi:hypothetical protein
MTVTQRAKPGAKNSISFKVGQLTFDRLRCIAESGASGDLEQPRTKRLRELANELDRAEQTRIGIRFHLVGTGEFINVELPPEHVVAVCQQVAECYGWRQSVARRQIERLVKAMFVSSPATLQESLRSIGTVRFIIDRTR